MAGENRHLVGITIWKKVMSIHIFEVFPNLTAYTSAKQFWDILRPLLLFITFKASFLQILELFPQ